MQQYDESSLLVLFCSLSTLTQQRSYMYTYRVLLKPRMGQDKAKPGILSGGYPQKKLPMHMYDRGPNVYYILFISLYTVHIRDTVLVIGLRM